MVYDCMCVACDGIRVASDGMCVMYDGMRVTRDSFVRRLMLYV